jgi:signal peptidase I
MKRTPAGETGPRRARLFRRVRDGAEILAVTIALALGVKTFIVDAVHVPSGSMENTLMVGDFLLVNKFVYGPSTPRFLPLLGSRLPVLRLPAPGSPGRGDVIVFYAPDGTLPRLYVKRLVGLPGDTVMLRHGAVFVDGREVAPALSAKPAHRPAPDFGPVVVPKAGEAILLRGSDASRWEPLIRLEGHVIARTLPGEVLLDGVPAGRYRVTEDYYFVLGDNRDESLDSRAWGFVPFDRIVGRAMMIYWSLDDRTGIRWGRVGTVVR